MTGIHWRRTSIGEWVICGPVDVITVGARVTVTRRDGTSSEHIIDHVREPFEKDGEMLVYGVPSSQPPPPTTTVPVEVAEHPDYRQLRRCVGRWDNTVHALEIEMRPVTVPEREWSQATKNHVAERRKLIAEYRADVEEVAALTGADEATIKTLVAELRHDERSYGRVTHELRQRQKEEA